MLNLRRSRGVSLIELMVVVTITGIALAMAIPTFGNWIAGVRIRSTAEALQAGLQYAKSEATSRNTQVRFQLTTTLDANCTLSTSGTNWVVDAVDADTTTDSVAGQCDLAPSDTTAPSILMKRANEVGNVSVLGSDSAVVFNGLGRQAVAAPATSAATVSIDITSPAGACAASGGPITCLRLLVSPAGQVRMCNPNMASGDPQAC
ncbi:pilus assembly FimT family protein [Roseateles sp.]|uniref:pilus assembly FimT family protein n=1 Tax=Roseateles sp. TaxID=1971397 RepID=UPI003BA90E22